MTPIPALTRREMDVLHLVAGGYRNKQIAVALGISLHTVRSHLEHIGRKVGAGRRDAMVLVAYRAGLIT